MLYSEFLKTKRKCPFCDRRDRILVGKKSAYLTYALAPYSRYHLLAVPRKHKTSLRALGPAERKDLAALVSKGTELLRRLHIADISVLVRDSGRQKSVEHIHYHIIPNHRIGDLDRGGRKRRILTQKEISALVAKVKKIL
ncbi:MAG TPA: HIT domain-containing protein [Candidatus Paceibacterota bacterium]|nr:HIT domain-containing protein [Candidatus Paceibacterota bacterium]